MNIAVCPGSFDPVTNGHIDIFERSSKIFDEIIVAVFLNPAKNSLFSIEERVNILKEATSHILNVKVDCFSGLLNQYVREQNSNVIIRGLRAFADFEYEFQRALLIKDIDPTIETIFIMTNNKYSFISSSAVKELAYFGGQISNMVPICVELKIFNKLNKNK